MSDPHVGRYQVLQHMPDADFAMSRLKKLISEVRPIMRKYNLYVQVLSEFYPNQQNLLGCNTGQGQLVEVRLRCTERVNEYLSFEAVLDTLLHELAHNHHTNHGPGFQQQWELYRRERYAILQGENILSAFSGPGQRLGGSGFPGGYIYGGFPGGYCGSSGGAWLQDMSTLAANAAQRRLMFAGSGQRVGGSSKAPPSITLEDGTRVVAGCPDRPALGIPGDNALPNAISVAETAAAHVREPPLRSPSPPFGGCPPRVIALDDDDSDSDVEIVGSSRTWSCPTCTFANPDIFLCCDACGSERTSNFSLSGPALLPAPVHHQNPHPVRRRKTTAKKSAAEMIVELDKKIAAKPLGWNCGSCGTFMESKWWTCSLCGTMKDA